MSEAFDVVGIGHAIVDMLTRCEDVTLTRLGIQKGVMQLVEQERGLFLHEQMSAPVQAPGGSVANTLAGLGKLGLRTAFLGRVADDGPGRFYAEAMTAGGTLFPNAPAAGADLPTSRCMIFVTPDGERSMNTYLGISGGFGAEDLDEGVIARARYLFLEGYLYDTDHGKAAFGAAARACRAAGGQAGIALSDPFCVTRHRDDFRRLVRELDFVIGNEHEWRELYETEDLGAALEQAAAECRLIVCTRSGADVVLQRGDEQAVVPVARVTPVDATGAGDQFAAGFLYGLASGRSLAVAGQMGVLAAAEVIGHVGARPETDVKARFERAGL